MVSSEPRTQGAGHGLQDLLLADTCPPSLVLVTGPHENPLLQNVPALLRPPRAGPAGPRQTLYQKPPKQVLDVLHAPAFPDAFVNPTRDAMILATPVSYPSIAYLAEPMLRLAGVRIIPRTRRLQDASYWSSFTLVALPGGGERRISLPEGVRVGPPIWSADGKRFAFHNLGANSVELWVGDAVAGTGRPIAGVRLNPFLGRPILWLPDQKTLLVRAVPEGQAPPGAGRGAARPGHPADLRAEGRQQHL